MEVLVLEPIVLVLVLTKKVLFTRLVAKQANHVTSPPSLKTHTVFVYKQAYPLWNLAPIRRNRSLLQGAVPLHSWDSEFLSCSRKRGGLILRLFRPWLIERSDIFPRYNVRSTDNVNKSESSATKVNPHHCAILPTAADETQRRPHSYNTRRRHHTDISLALSPTAVTTAW